MVNSTLSNPPHPYPLPQESGVEGNLALIFPGQGSQYVGMGKDLYSSCPHAREVFEEADKVLGFSISSLCFEGPEKKLNQTDITQPAILTVSIAAFRSLTARVPLKPSLLAGHSLGEYSALVVSGALSFPDALKLVNLRGRFMQEAVPEGTGRMAAIIGLDRSSVEELCKVVTRDDGNEIVVPANYNMPEQIVVSGHRRAVESVAEMVKQRGAKRVIALKVSVPSHSPLMTLAGERLAKELAEVDIGELNIPVITNLEAAPLTDNRRVEDILVRQLSNPVKWEESIQRMATDEINKVIEIGPGRVLSRLVKRIDDNLETYTFEKLEDMERIVVLTQGNIQ